MLDVFSLVLGASPAAVLPFMRRQSIELGTPADETELVQAALAGQRIAQHTLYVRYCDRVRARTTRLLGRSLDVDDVVQDTFVAAFRDLAQLADATHFGSWVSAIAVHQVHRRLRRRQMLRRLGLDRPPDDGSLTLIVDPSASPETQLSLKQLEQALLRLSPRPRIAWILRYVEGCNLAEVATQCSVSVATAKRDIAHAEATLQALILEPSWSQE